MVAGRNASRSADRIGDFALILIVLTVVVVIAAWKSQRTVGELYPLSQPTDLVGARTCLEHGFTWYTFEAGGVRCFRAEHPGAWNAEQTLLERALDRS